MEILLRLTLLASILISCVLSQSIPSGSTQITSTESAVSASYSLYVSTIETQCFNENQNTRSYPTGQSMENLIALIERLEQILANTTDSYLAGNRGAEKVARLLLRRFRFDGFDENIGSLPYKRTRDLQMDQINTAFLGKPETNNNYYFPDNLFSKEELCSLFYMLSHNIINTNTTSRTAYAPVVIKVNRNTPYTIKEEGVVSFRGNKNEAIATARVFIGIIAGLTQNIKYSVKEVLGETPVDPNYDKPIDPVMAMTIGDLWGNGFSNVNDHKSLYYGIYGEWSSTMCTTHYGLSSVTTDKFDLLLKTNKGTKAEIRGGIDGYLIGRALKSTRIDDPTKLRLSTVLRSYYSKPRISKTNSLTISYCDRSQQFIQNLQTNAQLYNAIQSYKFGYTPGLPLVSEFTVALQSAQTVESNGLSDYCSKPSGTLDKTAPCETPSDVIFIIDGQNQDKLQISGDIVSSVSGNLNNIRTEGGTVSVFFNSMGRNSVNPNIQLPFGPGDWPLIAVSFNSTNTGCTSCRLNDFNTTLPQPVSNTGKLFQYLNTSLFNYEWYGPRTYFSAVPGKTAVLIDLSSVTSPPDSGEDRNDYNNFKDQLKHRHRDVRYLSVATNQELFKDILRDNTDKETPGTVGSSNQNLGSNFAKKICENPATFQYNACRDRKSENVKYVGYVTPGYKQNWAMYPQFFFISSHIKFTFNSDEGDIKVCFDRHFPPERYDQYYCKELKSGEQKIFEISTPCKGQSLETCDPLYFTVWGKERNAFFQCLDERCASLDQIKFTVTHTGVQCSSSDDILLSTTLSSVEVSTHVDSNALLLSALNNTNIRIILIILHFYQSIVKMYL